MLRKKLSMVLAAICLVVVLAFGPRTVTNNHASNYKQKPSGITGKPFLEDKLSVDKAAPGYEILPVKHPEETSVVPQVQNILSPSNPMPQIPDPVAASTAVQQPILEQVPTEPEPLSFPPACGGCGRIMPKNNATIQCPMYQTSSEMVCALL